MHQSQRSDKADWFHSGGETQFVLPHKHPETNRDQSAPSPTEVCNQQEETKGTMSAAFKIIQDDFLTSAAGPVRVRKKLILFKLARR